MDGDCRDSLLSLVDKGLFFIVNREHPSAAPESAQAGVRDLERAKSLDTETRLYWRERGQTVEYALVEFGCLLRRARGMLTITNDSAFDDVWGIERLIEQAEDMLHDPQYINSKLFETVSLVARKQQVRPSLSCISRAIEVDGNDQCIAFHASGHRSMT
jgi:hypothetical protein